MSLIKINNLFEHQIGLLVSVTTLELDRVRGGGSDVATPALPISAPAQNPIFAPIALPIANPQNLLSKLGTSISYAFGQSQSHTTAAGPFSLTIGANFTGTYGINGSLQPFKSNIYYNTSYPGVGIQPKH
jgi:hypothetical protein